MRHLLVPVVLAAFVVGACTPAVEEPTTAPPPSPTVSVSASPSPTPEPSPSPTVAESFPPAPASESPEQAAVRAAWMEYWETFETYAQRPELTDFTRLQNLLEGEEARLSLESIRNLRESGKKAAGGLAFRSVELEVQQSSASVAYCLDRSNLALEDLSTGEVELGSLPNLSETATLSKGDDGKWRVSQIRNVEAEC